MLLRMELEEFVILESAEISFSDGLNVVTGETGTGKSILCDAIGYLAGGRMGHHWGLGMLGNGGDCPDCDSGDSETGFGTTACNDGVDNDGDGATDCADSDCAGTAACSEVCTNGTESVTIDSTSSSPSEIARMAVGQTRGANQENRICLSIVCVDRAGTWMTSPSLGRQK